MHVSSSTFLILSCVWAEAACAADIPVDDPTRALVAATSADTSSHQLDSSGPPAPPPPPPEAYSVCPDPHAAAAGQVNTEPQLLFSGP